MRRLATLLVVFGAALGSPVRAQTAPAPASAGGGSLGLGGGGGPIDLTSDSQERVSPLHVVAKGNVEALQGTARLRTPQLDIFYAQRTGAPSAATSGPTGIGKVERMEATGPVYYVSQTQTARGDHGTYIAAEDAIILDGNVVLTQGQNVSTGDHLVMHQKSNQAILTSAAGKRTRAVIYPNQPAQPGAPAKAAKPAARS